MQPLFQRFKLLPAHVPSQRMSSSGLAGQVQTTCLPRSFASVANKMSDSGGLSALDKSLVSLFLHICNHRWDRLVELGHKCYEDKASTQQVLGCMRHVVVTSGYPASLAAAKRLHAAGLIPEAVPGKCRGQPGNAFDLVYADKAQKVWHNLYGIEPVLSEWIRLHCYGDIYSTPGLSLKQKQLMISAFLAEADMSDEFFGHVLAAARFGCNQTEVQEAVNLAFDIAQTSQEKKTLLAHMSRLIQKACGKVRAAFPDGLPPLIEAQNDPSSVFLPEEPK